MLRINDDFTSISVNAGEAWIFEHQLKASSGAVQDINDAGMVLTVYEARDRTAIVDQQVGERLSDGEGEFFRWAKPGTFTETLLARGTPLLVELARRRGEGSKSVIRTFNVVVASSAAGVPALAGEPIAEVATRFTVRAGNSLGSPPTFAVTYVAYGVVAPTPAPTFTSQPSVSGTARVGQTLSSNDGAVTGGTITGREWLRNGVAITGATGTSYALVAADGGAAVSLRVTATGAGGTVTAISNPTSAVALPTVTLSGDLAINEGNSGTTDFTYTVTRTYTVGALLVPWTFQAGTTSPDDYLGGTLPAGGTITIADGAATGSVTIKVQGDMTPEPDETATISIVAPSGYASGTRMSSRLTILNDDLALSLPADHFVYVNAQDATTANVIRNRSATTALPTSIWGPTRPGEHPLLLLFGNNATVTSGETGRDGSPLAVRMEYSTGGNRIWFLQGVGSSTYPSGVTIPAGTWTFSCDAKSLTGGDQTIRIEDQAGRISGSTTHVVTGSWQTFSRTFTVASEGISRFLIRVVDTSPAGSMAFDNFSLVSGSAAGTPEASLNHMARIGRFVKSGQAIRANVVTSSTLNGTEAQAFLPFGGSPAKVEALSFAVAMKQDAVADFTGKIFPILTEARSPYVSTGNGAFELGWVGNQFGFQGLGATPATTIFAGPDKAGWCTVTGTFGPSGSDIYINSVRVASSSAAPSAPTLDTLGFFARNYGSGLGADVQSFAGWRRVLSQAEVTQAHRFLVEEVRSTGETFFDMPVVGICEGDSITAGGIVGGQTVNAIRRFSIKPQFISYAIPGNGIGTLEGRKAVVGARIAEIKALGKQVVLSVLIGANDTDTIFANPVAAAARVASYWAWGKAQGAKVVGASLTAFDGFTTDQQSKLAAHNAELRRLAQAGGCDAFVDYAAGEMGTWSSTNFGDFVHPNNAGYAVMGLQLYSAMAPLFPGQA